MTSIDFPADDQGRRSTSAFGKAVVADALRQVDPTGAAAAQREPNWRAGYVAHMRRLVEAGLASPEDWRTIARSGLDSIHSRLVVGDQPLAEWSARSQPPKTAVIKGEAEPLEELVIPYRGQRLKGAELQAQLESWQEAGVLEPGVIDAVLTVAANPEWLRADGRTIVAWGVLASRVDEVDARTTVLENEIKAYPSKDYFEEKFKNTNDRLNRLDSSLTRRIERIETLKQ